MLEAALDKDKIETEKPFFHQEKKVGKNITIDKKINNSKVVGVPA